MTEVSPAGLDGEVAELLVGKCAPDGEPSIVAGHRVAGGDARHGLDAYPRKPGPIEVGDQHLFVGEFARAAQDLQASSSEK